MEQSVSEEIFISYRRSDSAGHAGRLFAELAKHYSAGLIFFDTRAIELGDQFETRIRKSIAESSVFIAVIGPTWLSAVTNEGERRIDKADDLVHIEVSTALDNKRAFGRPLIVPTLVGNAVMPSPDQLPAQLRELSGLQAIEIRHSCFEDDVSRLAGKLDAKVSRANIEPDRSAPNLLSMTWPQLEPDLQMAFGIAYALAKRSGTNRVSTRMFFAALAELQPTSARKLIEAFGEAFTPPSKMGAVDKQAVVKDAQLEFSDCLTESLGHFGGFARRGRSITAADMLVDIAKHGTGSSVRRLRAHGIGPDDVDRLARDAGIRPLGRVSDETE